MWKKKTVFLWDTAGNPVWEKTVESEQSAEDLVLIILHTHRASHIKRKVKNAGSLLKRRTIHSHSNG